MNTNKATQLHIQIRRDSELNSKETSQIGLLAQQCRNRYNHIFQDFHLHSIDGYNQIRLELKLTYRPHRGMPFGFNAISGFLNTLQKTLVDVGQWTIADELVLLRKKSDQYSYTQGVLLPYSPPLPYIPHQFRHGISISPARTPKDLEDFRDFLHVVAFRADNSLYATEYLRLGLRYQEELLRQFAKGPDTNAAAKLLQPLLHRHLIDDPSIRIVAKRLLREGSSITRQHASRILALASTPSSRSLKNDINRFGGHFTRNVQAIQKTTDTLQGIDTANTSQMGISIIDVADGIIQSPDFLISMARSFESKDYFSLDIDESDTITGLCLLLLHLTPFHSAFPGLKRHLLKCTLSKAYHWSVRALCAHTLFRIYPNTDIKPLFKETDSFHPELLREIFRVIAELPNGLGRLILRQHFNNPKYTSWVLQASAIHSDPIILQLAKKQYLNKNPLFQGPFLFHLRDLAGTSTRAILNQIKGYTHPSLGKGYQKLSLMLKTIAELQRIHLRLPQLLALMSHASKTADFRYWPLVIQSTSAVQEELREAAADVLGAYASPVCTPHLLELLNDSKEIVVLAAIKALGSTGDTKAFPVLRKLAKGKSNKRTYARIAIRELGNPPQSNDPKIRIRIQSLSPLSTEERQTITTVLQKSSMIAQFQLRSVEGMLRISSDTVPLLHQLCHYFNEIHKLHPHLRWSIHDTYGLLRYDGNKFFVSNTTGRLIRAAGWIGSAPQSGHYRQLLPQNQVSTSSEHTLHESGPSVERLRTALKDNGRDPQLEDVYLSGVSEAEIEILIRWLQAENIQRVIEACIIIRRLGVEETLPYLLPLLNSHEFDVQRYAVDALGQIGDSNTLEHLKAKEIKATNRIKGILQEAIASIESVLSV